MGFDGAQPNGFGLALASRGHGTQPLVPDMAEWRNAVAAVPLRRTLLMAP